LLATTILLNFIRNVRPTGKPPVQNKTFMLNTNNFQAKQLLLLLFVLLATVNIHAQINGSDSPCNPTDLTPFIDPTGLPSIVLAQSLNNADIPDINPDCVDGTISNFYQFTLPPGFTNMMVTLIPDPINPQAYQMSMLTGLACSTPPVQSFIATTDDCAQFPGDTLFSTTQLGCLLTSTPVILHISAGVGRYQLVLQPYGNTAITSSTGDSVFCLGDSIILSGYDFPGLFHQWDNGVTGPNLPVNQTGQYILVTFDSLNYCMVQDTFLAIVDSLCVWPGDANIDGISDAIDLLAIGLAFDATGPARQNASAQWIGQSVPQWQQSFQTGVFTGINFKNADCNGDGVVDFLDVPVITKNYGRHHQLKTQGPRGSHTDPPLFLSFSKDTFNMGDTVVAYVHLGTDTLTLDSLYSFSFDLNYDITLIDTNSIELTFDSTFIDNDSSDIISLAESVPSGAFVDVASSRTNLIDISGDGKVATFIYILEDNLGGAKVQKALQAVFTFTDVLVLNHLGNPISVNVITDSVVVLQSCESWGGSTQHEWIKKLCGNSSCKTSNDNGGYAEFTVNTKLTRFKQYTFGLVPGYSGPQRKEHWRLWMDVNQDGDFDDSLELLIDTTGKGPLSSKATIPGTSKLGWTYLRFQMKRFDSLPPAACDTFALGEVEDYFIRIKKHPLEKIGQPGQPDSHNGSKLLTAHIYPNPAQRQVIIAIELGQGLPIRQSPVTLKLLDISGRLCHQIILPAGEPTSPYALSIDKWQNGIYQVWIETNGQRLVKKLVIVK